MASPCPAGTRALSCPAWERSRRRCRCPAALPQSKPRPQRRSPQHRLETRAPVLKPSGDPPEGLRSLPGTTSCFPRTLPAPPRAVPGAAGPYSPRRGALRRRSRQQPRWLLAPLCTCARERGQGSEAAPTHPTCGSAAATPSPAAYVWPCMRGAGGTARYDTAGQGRARHPAARGGGRRLIPACRARPGGTGLPQPSGFWDSRESSGGRRWPFSGAWRRVTSLRPRGNRCSRARRVTAPELTAGGACGDWGGECESPRLDSVLGISGACPNAPAAAHPARTRSSPRAAPRHHPGMRCSERHCARGARWPSTAGGSGTAPEAGRASARH